MGCGAKGIPSGGYSGKMAMFVAGGVGSIFTCLSSRLPGKVVDTDAIAVVGTHSGSTQQLTK